MNGHDEHLLQIAEDQDGYRCHYCEKVFYLFDVDIFECRCGNFVCHNCTVDEGNNCCSDECIEHLPEIE